MKAIKSKDVSMRVDFEGSTYTLPKGKSVMVEDSLKAFLFERWPLAFEVVKKSKKPFPKVSKKETPKMTKNTVVPTFGKTSKEANETEGEDWYGEGATIE